MISSVKPYSLLDSLIRASLKKHAVIATCCGGLFLQLTAFMLPLRCQILYCFLFSFMAHNMCFIFAYEKLGVAVTVVHF